MMDEIPERLRRDAQNKAPFMSPPHNHGDLQMPVQWPDPRLGMPVGPTGELDPWNMPPVQCTLCSAEPSPMFYTGCMVKDGHAPEWNCDGRGSLTPNPSDNPQVTSQDWVPPWGSKS